MWKDGTSGDVSMVTLAVRSDVCKGDNPPSLLGKDELAGGA